MTEASLVINGKHEPLRPLSTTTTGKRKREAYERFLNQTGRDRWTSNAVNISCEEYFTKGYYILAWDRTASRDNRWTRQIMNSGYITTNFICETNITKNLTILIYVSYSDFLELDQTNSNVTAQVVG